MRPQTVNLSSRGHKPEWVRTMERVADTSQFHQPLEERTWLGQQVLLEEPSDCTIDRWHLRPVEVRRVVQQLGEKS
jgi:hypothetical protein